MLLRKRLGPVTVGDAANSAQQTADRVARFIPPQVLEGESDADFKDLLTRICAKVTPVDVIEEMFVADVASLQWQLLRWRRLEWTWLRTLQLGELRGFVAKHLDEDLYAEQLAQWLAANIKGKLPEGQAETLAEKYVQGEASAVKKMNEILGDRIGAIDRAARQSKAEGLVQEYAQRKPAAVRLIDELLTDAGLNMDALTADALTDGGRVKPFESIEQFERLATLAESRLSARLREIEQRRAIFGTTLRRSAQEVEAANTN
jgi:hypothetical protein